MTDNRYCYVCGFDFNLSDPSQDSVKRYTLCDCCLFHYGINDVGYIDAWIHDRDELDCPPNLGHSVKIGKK